MVLSPLWTQILISDMFLGLIKNSEDLKLDYAESSARMIADMRESLFLCLRTHGESEINQQHGHANSV